MTKGRRRQSNVLFIPKDKKYTAGFDKMGKEGIWKYKSLPSTKAMIVGGADL